MFTEEVGITYLKQILLKSDYINPEITSNDKTISWDGFIYLYSKPSDKHKKKDFFGRIPIQVKSLGKKSIKNKNYSHNVKLVDLKNYQKDNGVIYFIVRISPEQKAKIYYKVLQHLDLARILKKHNDLKEQASISLKFEEFPKDPVIFTEIFMNYIEDEKKQKSIINPDKLYFKDWVDDFEHIESLVIQLTSLDFKTKNPYKILSSKEFYLYAKPKGIGGAVVLDKINKLEFTIKNNISISVNNIDYYQYANTKWSNGVPTLVTGNGVDLIWQEQNPENLKITVKFSEKGNLSERLNDLNFICALDSSREIKINNQSFSYKNMRIEEMEQIKQKREYYILLQKKLQEFDVKKELNLDNLTQDELSKLNLLLGKQPRNEYYKKLNNAALYPFKVQNLNLLVFTKIEDKMIFLKNFFNIKVDAFFVLNDSKERIEASQFLSLSKELLLSDNFNAKFIFEDISKLKSSQYILERANLFLLEVIKAYDDAIENKESYLMLCDSLANWLLQNCESENDLYFMNYCQINLRKFEAISEEEKKKLKNIQDNNSDNLQIKAGVEILLGNFEVVSDIIQNMNEKEREEFILYPIYRLYKNNLS